MKRLLAGVLSVLAIGGPAFSQSDDGDLTAAVLPNSRTAVVGETVTVFATVINLRNTNYLQCSVSLAGDDPYNFSYRLTDANNVPIGEVNAPFPMDPQGSQSLVFSFTPTAAAPGTHVELDYVCDTNRRANVLPGVNTVYLTAAAEPAADIIPIMVTSSGDGLLQYEEGQPVRAMSAAAVNIGAAADIEVTAFAPHLPNSVELTVCETNSGTGQCLAARASSVNVNFANNQVRTFAVFSRLREGAAIPNIPALSRIYLLFSGVPANSDTDAPSALFPPNPPVLGTTSVAAASPLPADRQRFGVYRGTMGGETVTLLYHGTDQIIVGTPEALSDGFQSGPTLLSNNRGNSVVSSGYADGEYLPSAGVGLTGFQVNGGSHVRGQYRHLDRAAEYPFLAIWDPVSDDVFVPDDIPSGTWDLRHDGTSLGTVVIDASGSVSGSVTWPVADGAEAGTCNLAGVAGGAQQIGINLATLALNTTPCGPNYFVYGYYQEVGGALTISGYASKQGSRNGTLDFMPVELVRQQIR